jgi:hypothetical protein
MNADNSAIDRQLQPETAFIAVDKGGNADKKGDDADPWASQYAVMKAP